MNIKTIGIIVVTCLLAWPSLTGPASAASDIIQGEPLLQIYLPREVTIDSDTINLGQISIVRGEESLVVKANKIALGQISLPGQQITIDRQTVLSRLACSEIPSSKVILTGAEAVLVKREHQVIKGSRFVEEAFSLVKKNPPDDSICEFGPVRIPEDLLLAGPAQNIKLVPCFLKSSVKNQVKVRITVFSGDKEAGMREVTFHLKYNHSKAVTIVDVPQGEVISSENVKVEKAILNYPEPDNQIAPYGLVTKRRLQANTVIRPDMVEVPQPPVLLKRNQNVVIRIDGSGFLVTAVGKAVQEGKAGEYIRVQNMDSQRIILAKVNEDGTVEPVF